MSGSRKERVAQAIRNDLSELITREVKDPRVSAAGFVGINHVEVNRDISMARIYVSFFGGDDSERAVQQAMAGLAASAGFLRGQVARHLGLKRAPELRFFHDVGPEFRASLDEIRRDDAERVVSEEPDKEPSDDRGD